MLEKLQNDKIECYEKITNDDVTLNEKVKKIDIDIADNLLIQQRKNF